MADVLIVDDEQSICWGLSRLCKGLGHTATAAASAEEGLRLAEHGAFDLVLLDVRLPGMDGLTALEGLRSRLAGAPVIVMTAFGALDVAVRAVRSGAFEYVLKPFDLGEIRSVIRRALRAAGDATPPAAPAATDEMIGETPVMQGLFKRIALAAGSDANVVLQGETGVGKELAARAIHRYSQRAEGPFVAVNLASLSPTVVESELFGHADGAFTGASRARRGLLAAADGGTLFLDEVAEMPLSLQVKLLRAIEGGEVLPVGADAPVASRFRIVAATHRDLKQSVRSGAFRHDLYYRLCSFEIAIPPLRERVDDVPLLAGHFAARFQGGAFGLASETIEELRRRPWYGNIRELRNAIEHAAVVARSGVIQPEHLPEAQPRLDEADTASVATPTLAEAAASRSAALLTDPGAAGAVYERMLSEMEAPLLSAAIRHFDNECAPAARALGLHRTTLKRKLTQHGIDPGRDE